MTEKTLHTGWKMRRLGEMEWLPATVPGSVYGDLLANGRMENPFWKDNEDKALELMEYDYEYTMQFDCPEDILDKDRILLHFDGLDTIADVFLNGEHLGDAFNMHRIWEYDIREKVKPAENELRVVLHLPINISGKPSGSAGHWEMMIRWKGLCISGKPIICSAGTGALTCRMRGFSARSLFWGLTEGVSIMC